MAKKLSVAVLFLFFTLSFARTPVNDVTHFKLNSGNDVILPELPKTLPENDVILPELPKTLPGNEVILPELPKTLPESDNSMPTVNLPSKSDDEEARSVHPMPLNFVRFRPINRRSRLRSNLPFRLCHHLKPGSRSQIHFGNDMILSSKRSNIDFDKFVYRIGVHQIPSDRFDFGHHQYNDKTIWNFDNDHEQRKISKFVDDPEKFGEVKLKDQLPHHHHHHDDNEDNDHEQRKISKFLDDPEKFGEMKLKDQLPHHRHRHDDNEDNDHEQRKISKFLDDPEKFDEVKLKDQLPQHIKNRGNFGEIKSKNENRFRSYRFNDEADNKRSKLYGKYYDMKLRKRVRYDNGEEEDEKAKDETKWHKEEKKKGGFMKGIRKFLHHYFD